MSLVPVGSAKWKIVSAARTNSSIAGSVSFARSSSSRSFRASAADVRDVAHANASRSVARRCDARGHRASRRRCSPRLVEQPRRAAPRRARRARCTARRARAAPARAAAHGRARAAAASRARTSRRARRAPPRGRTARAASRSARRARAPGRAARTASGSRAASARGRRAARGRGSRSVARWGSSSSPAVGAARPASTRSSVVLPEPFGPVTSRKPPRASSRSTPSKTRCRRSASRGRGAESPSGYTSAAARWNPSGCPAARRCRAISSISPTQRQPFFAADALGTRAAVRRARARRAPIRPRPRSRARRRGSRGASPSSPSTTRRTPSSAPRRSRRRACASARAGEERGHRVGVGTGEVERRPGLRRRAADDATVDERAAAARQPRAHAAARSRSRRRRCRSKPAHAGDVDRGVRRADGEDRRRPRRRGPPTVPASRNVAGARARRVTAPRGRPDHVARSHRSTADRRAHLAGMEQADDHKTSASTKTKNATRDDAVHREERRVEPAQVARPDERVLVDEQARRRRRRRASRGRRRAARGRRRRAGRASRVQGARAPRTRRARRTASPTSAAPASRSTSTSKSA